MCPVVLSPVAAEGFFAHSSYLFGMLGVLACSALGGRTASMAAAILVVGGGIVLDQRAGIESHEVAARGVVFTIVASAAIHFIEALRRSRRRAADATAGLLRERALLQSVLDTGPDAMLMIDGKGVISRFSAAAEQLFGWTASQAVGRDISILMPDPYRSEHESYISQYLATGQKGVIGKSRQVVGLARDGTQFPMMLHVGEVDLDGEPHFTGFVHDLTALEQANARNQRLQDQLTHVWSMNSLGEMAAILAHELNQPLSAITNYLRGARVMVARLELEEDDLLNAVDLAGDQALRAGEIIRRMRSLVMRNDMDHKPESLSGLIREIDFIIGLVARERNVSVRYSFDEGPDEVLVDKVQIQQVITNLVRNATEAMRNGPDGKLHIGTVHRPYGWVVQVEDSGPGVPKTLLKNLFAPLNSSKSQGMGLGLSISRTIIETHKGEIWVERSRWGGAMFCFSIPAPVRVG